MALDDQKGTAFRDVFKDFKKKRIPSDWDHAKFRIPENKQVKYQQRSCYDRETEFNWERTFGIKAPGEWQIFDIVEKPGLIFIKNPFTSCGQRYWIIRCLKYFTKKPNRLNIDAHNLLDPDQDLWDFCQRENEEGKNKILLEKLRWITMGYHHNWDTKEYSESSKSEFPLDLNELCKKVTQKLGFLDFNGEAAIINFYHSDSHLSGHTDHSEVNKEAPLLSFSFGQSAIFLIGGKSLQDEPIPILLESGDIMIMSKESRLCYHGVPKIVPSNRTPWKFTENEILTSQYLDERVIDEVNDQVAWKPFDDYVNKSRINMNVRQVLHFQQKRLPL